MELQGIHFGARWFQLTLPGFHRPFETIYNGQEGIWSCLSSAIICIVHFMAPSTWTSFLHGTFFALD